MEEPASTPRDPTCVPVRTAGGLWEVAGLVKVKQDTFYKQILGNHLSYSTNRLGGGGQKFILESQTSTVFFFYVISWLTMVHVFL